MFEPSTPNESDYGEAMTLLLKLDKDLRSGIVSQQCLAIIRFSDLISNFPLPLIVTSSTLKLAELYVSW
jgi:hypothetical protein